jgi:hypothetical protein
VKAPIAIGGAALLALAALAGAAAAGPIGSNVSPRVSGNIHGSMSSIGSTSIDRSGGVRQFQRFDSDGLEQVPSPKKSLKGPRPTCKGRTC